MQVSVKNISVSEIEIEVNTLDRLKGTLYVLLESGKSTEVDKEQLTDQVRVLARKKKTRGPILELTPSLSDLEAAEEAERLGAIARLEELKQAKIAKKTAVKTTERVEEKDESFVCPECELEFDTEEALEEHDDVHDIPEDDPDADEDDPDFDDDMADFYEE